MVFRVILFDFDGTIVDSKTYHMKCVKNALKDIYPNAKIGSKFFSETYWGTRYFDRLKDMFPKRHTEIYSRFSYYFRKNAGSIKPFPGIIRLLKSIKQGKKEAALVSSKDRALLTLVLKKLGLDSAFDCAVFGDEKFEQRQIRTKPSPEPIFLALKRLKRSNEKPENILFVGDSIQDVLSAKNAGIKSCLAIWGIPKKEKLKFAKKVEPDFLAKRPSEVIKIILK